MTLRDWFAGMALQSLISSGRYEHDDTGDGDWVWNTSPEYDDEGDLTGRCYVTSVRCAYEYADQMIKERSKGGQS